MTTKRTPAVGDTIEVLDEGRWVPCAVTNVGTRLVAVCSPRGTTWRMLDSEWRWPGEAVDGTQRGRPRLPVTEKRRAVTLWLSPAERAELDAYAVREGAALSEAIREAALRAARDVATFASVFSERVPDPTPAVIDDTLDAAEEMARQERVDATARLLFVAIWPNGQTFSSVGSGGADAAYRRANDLEAARERYIASRKGGAK